MIKFKPFRPFLRKTDTLAYRGNVCNQKGSYKVHWTITKTACKKAFLGTDKTAIVAYSCNVYNQKGIS